MATHWYFRTLDEEMGPVPFGELLEMVRSGALGEDDLVRSDWEENWQRARSVPGLFYMASRKTLAPTECAPADRAGVPDGEAATASTAETDAEGEVVAGEGSEAEESRRQPWLEKLIGLRDGWLETQATMSRAASGPASGTAEGDRADGRFASLVQQAVDRLEQQNAPPRGRLARLLWRTRRALAATMSPALLRQAVRLGAALVGANLTALWVDHWTTREALRFPSRGPTSEVQFPFVGTCSSEEYVLLLMVSAILAGILSYAVAVFLESRAEDR